MNHRGRQVRVKICGVTTVEGVAAVVDSGADAVGFVFADSPRRVDPERACELARGLPPLVSRVAVLRHPAPHEIADVVRCFGPDVVQCEPVAGLREILGRGVRWLPVLHDGGEDLLVQLDRLAGVAGEPPQAVLLEAAGRGGRGIAPDHRRAAELARRCRLVLAGGLRPDNVAAAIRHVRPWAVDASSGVESAPGIKDPDLVRRFAGAARDAGDAAVARGSDLAGDPMGDPR